MLRIKFSMNIFLRKIFGKIRYQRRRGGPKYFVTNCHIGDGNAKKLPQNLLHILGMAPELF